MGDFGKGMFWFWILEFKNGTTPTPILTHIISLYAKESIRDAENPGSKITRPGFLPVFEREEQVHVGLGRYRFTVPLDCLQICLLLLFPAALTYPTNIWHFPEKKKIQKFWAHSKIHKLSSPEVTEKFLHLHWAKTTEDKLF